MPVKITHLCVILLTLLTAACSHRVTPKEFKPNRFAAWEEIPSEYRLRPGDEIDVRLTYSPELSDRVQIAPDGRIALTLIGQIRAEGMTATELSAEIRRRFSQHLRKPDTTVIPRQFSSQQIFVGGEVREPGVKTLPGRIGVMEAIFLAGGFTPAASMRDVAIVRRGKDFRPMLKVYDLKDWLQAADKAELDVRLQPFDMIFVPRTKIADINIFVDQYITQMTPFISKGFSYSVSQDITSASRRTSTTIQQNVPAAAGTTIVP